MTDLITRCRPSRWRSMMTGVSVLAAVAAGSAFAGEQAMTFERIAAFPVFLNTDVDLETVAEIVSATADGTLLVYTDSETGNIGFVDITDPASPAADGVVAVDGEPTAVSVTGNYALAGVNTSRDFVNPSGHLAVIDIATRAVVRSIDLGGQPDSVAVSADGQYCVIAIENERDEDLGNGEPPQLPAGFVVIVDLVGEPDAWTTRVVELTGIPTLFPEDPEPEFVDINGLNQAVVTLQENNHLVIIDLASGTVISDAAAGEVDLDQIDTVENELIQLDSSLNAVPREADGVTWISDSMFATADEGDLFGGSRGFTIYAAENLLQEGGPIRPEFGSGNSLEHLVARLGHYPEERSENKGNEPEAAEYGEYGSGADDLTRYLFIGSERSSVVAVYTLPSTCAEDLDGNGQVDGGDLGALLGAWGDCADCPADLDGNGVIDGGDLGILLGAWGPCGGDPELLQVLPAGVGPEGLLAIPGRDLLVVASEVDSRDDKIRSTISIYERTGSKTYPAITSGDRPDGTPRPWAALSALVADPENGETVYSVYDSFYRKSRILSGTLAGDSPLTIDGEIMLRDLNGTLFDALTDLKAELPGTDDFVVDALFNTDGDDSVNLDPEGVTVATAPKGVVLGTAWWVASEGTGNLVDGVSDPDDRPFERPNMLVKVDGEGTIIDAVFPPLELTRNQLRFGFEGVASVLEDNVEILYVAFQRAWPSAGDPSDMARIGRYDTSTDSWTFAFYPLDTPTSPAGGWVGLSEITAVGDGVFAVIERDNQGGPDATIKRVTTLSVAGVNFLPEAQDGPSFQVLDKALERDVLAEDDYNAGVVLEKLEGLAVLADGTVLIVNDNDGVDDSSGETQLIRLEGLFND